MFIDPERHIRVVCDAFRPAIFREHFTRPRSEGIIEHPLRHSESRIKDDIRGSTLS